LAKNEISAIQFTALDDLRRALPERAGYVDPLELSDREQALQAWLARRGIVRPWELAATLARAGADRRWADRVAAVLPGDDLEPGLRWAASTAAVGSLLTEVRESTGRVSELVAAVRSYSQLDRASLQRVRIVDGLESTLVMLGHKLRGITVERAYAAELPEIDGYPGELNQVWTNLIDNAADAMDGEGTLRLSTRPGDDGRTVVVEIGDTGSGLPPDVLARAFEPFFTTKDVGSGTGLGLDIARRIVVERHDGEVAIDSVPGRTVVRVTLPIESAAPAS
jgi:signal transduction histidine kinase